MAKSSKPPATPPRGLRRAFLLVTGSVALVLGLLGVVLPLLPTTPFILLAAACFAGTWPTMFRRLAGSRLFGPMLRTEPGARHIPLGTKVYAITFTWVSIGITIAFAAEAMWLRLLLAAIAMGVTGFLLWMPSRPRAGYAAPMETTPTIERLWIRPVKSGAMAPQDELVLLTGEGVQGDHTLGSKRHVTLVFAEGWRAATAELGVDVDPMERRANVLLSGQGSLDLVGSTVRLGEVRLEILGETKPCSVMDAAAEGLLDALRPEGRGGVWGRVLAGGVLRPGAALEVEGSDS